jgi:hypothetical protein
MLYNFIEILDNKFCINYGELKTCTYCNGCNLKCSLYESRNSRLAELKNISTSNIREHL